jgi:hypothetical protein
MTLKLATFLPVIKVSENHKDEDIGLPYPNIDNVKNIDDKVVKISKLNNGNFRLTFNLSTGVEHLDITEDKFKPRTKFIVYVSENKGLLWIDTAYLNKSIDGYAKLYYHMRARKGAAVNVYFHDSFNEGMIFSNYRVISDEEFIITNKSVWLHTFIAEHFPESKKVLVDNINAKNKILYDINTIDSIVALEQQVDLLTDLVKGLINNQQAPSWTEEFFDKTINNSVTTVINSNKAINSIEKQKKILRQAQREYFEAIE